MPRRRKYSTIDSPYIQSRIAVTPFEDRKIIDDLIRLHGWVRSEPTTATSARAYAIVRRRHHDAWVTLFREHSEDAYAAWLTANERAERQRQLRLERAEQEEEARTEAEMEDWLRAGGRPPMPAPGASPRA